METEFTWRQPWVADAHCRGEAGRRGYQHFFSSDPAIIKQTKQDYCYRCPVRAECLAYASQEHLVGLYGGYTDDERSVFVTAWRRRGLSGESVEDFARTYLAAS